MISLGKAVFFGDPARGDRLVRQQIFGFQRKEGRQRGQNPIFFCQVQVASALPISSFDIKEVWNCFELSPKISTNGSKLPNKISKFGNFVTQSPRPIQKELWDGFGKSYSNLQRRSTTNFCLVKRSA